MTPGTRYRALTKLAASILYLITKLEEISIDQEDIVRACEMSIKELSEFNLKIYPLRRKRIYRKRKIGVLQALLAMSEQFEV